MAASKHCIHSQWEKRDCVHSNRLLFAEDFSHNFSGFRFYVHFMGCWVYQSYNDPDATEVCM